MSRAAANTRVSHRVTAQGLGILLTYGKFMGQFYLGILILWGLLSAAEFLLLGPRIARWSA